MKKFSILFFVAACSLLASCQKDPDIDKLDNNYIVYTNYDNGPDFNELNTFHIIDSILIINNEEKATYWNNANSEKIITAYSNELKSAGYTQVESIDAADIILQLSYVNTT